MDMHMAYTKINEIYVTFQEFVADSGEICRGKFKFADQSKCLVAYICLINALFGEYQTFIRIAHV